MRRLFNHAMMQMRLAREQKRAIKAARQNARHLRRSLAPRLQRELTEVRPAEVIPTLDPSAARDITGLWLHAVDPMPAPRGLLRPAMLEPRPGGHYMALKLTDKSVTVEAGIDWMKDRPADQERKRLPPIKAGSLIPLHTRCFAAGKRKAISDEFAGMEPIDPWLGISSRGPTA
jgi:hypothetical protein